MLEEGEASLADAGNVGALRPSGTGDTAGVRPVPQTPLQDRALWVSLESAGSCEDDWLKHPCASIVPIEAQKIQ